MVGGIAAVTTQIHHNIGDAVEEFLRHVSREIDGWPALFDGRCTAVVMPRGSQSFGIISIVAYTQTDRATTCMDSVSMQVWRLVRVRDIQLAASLTISRLRGIVRARIDQTHRQTKAQLSNGH